MYKYDPRNSRDEDGYEYDPSDYDYDYDPVEAEMAEDGWCDKDEYLDAMRGLYD